MNLKASSILEKAREERRRSHFKKALARVEEGVEKFPKELDLYTQAVDLAMEAGESLKAIQFFKKCQRELPDQSFELWTFTAEKISTYSDPIVGRFLMENAVKNSDLSAAHAILRALSDDSAGELLERIRTKKQTVASGPSASVADEVVSYALSEALIHLRLGHFPQAMEGFVQLIERYPARCRMLEPLLTELEREHSEKAEASFALGCCHLSAGRHAKAVEYLVRACKAPTLVARVIPKIEGMREHPEFPMERRQLTLVELHLKNNDLERAASISTAILAASPALAGELTDLLKPAVESIGEDLKIHFVFIQASSAASRKETALSHLRKIYRSPHHQAALIEWMEAQSQSEQLSGEFQLFFAETALSEKLYGKALDILKSALSKNGDDQAAVKELLSRYQSVPAVQDCYHRWFGASKSAEVRAESEFERYDDRHFSSSAAETFEERREGPDKKETGAEAKAPPPLETVELARRTLASQRESGPQDSPPDFDNRDFSLSLHQKEDADSAVSPFDHPKSAAGKIPSRSPDGDPRPAREGTDFAVKQAGWENQGETEESDLLEYLKRDFSGQARPASREDNLRDAPPEPVESPMEAYAGPTEQDPIELSEIAYREDRLAEMKKHLDFEPANLGEEVARKRQLGRYYLAVGQPLFALIALKSVQPGALGKAETRTFQLLLAESYSQLHNYEAAHAVYLRMLSDHPADPIVELSAKANYAKYLGAAAGAAPALEKQTTL